MSEPEYKIVSDLAPQVQKVLNQWKHTYNIFIHHMSAFTDKDGVVRVMLLLERSLKKEVA